MGGCTDDECGTKDSDERSAVAELLATTSLDLKKRSFGSSSVCALLSTMVGFCHSAAVDAFAAVAAAVVVAAVAAVASPDVDDVVAK